MIRIAICDDNQEELNVESTLIKKYQLIRNISNISVDVYLSSLELLEKIEENGGYDIVLLDIYMPGVLGTDVAKELRKRMDNCQILFLTSSRDHAIEAFALNAAHYLVKPFAEADYFTAIDKAISLLGKKEEKYITLSSPSGIRKIVLSTILFSETKNHMQQIYLSDGEIIVIRKSSEELFDFLKSDGRFYKCGRTYIFNMDYIVGLSSKLISISTGIHIPMMSRKYSEFKKKYLDYHFDKVEGVC